MYQQVAPREMYVKHQPKKQTNKQTKHTHTHTKTKTKKQQQQQ